MITTASGFMQHACPTCPGVTKPVSAPHDPLNPLNAAYDMRAYEDGKVACLGFA